MSTQGTFVPLLLFLACFQMHFLFHLRTHSEYTGENQLLFFHGDSTSLCPQFAATHDKTQEGLFYLSFGSKKKESKKKYWFPYYDEENILYFGSGMLNN